MLKRPYLIFSSIIGLILCVTAAISALWQRSPKQEHQIYQQRFWVEEVASGLKYPSSVAWLPDGNILVTELRGGLRLIEKGRLRPDPIEGVPKSFQNSFNGLKDIVLDPDFRSNRTIYLLVAEGTYNAHFAAVYRATYDARRLNNVQRIYLSKGNVGGPGAIAGRMILLKDQTLLFSVTDDNYHRNLTQNLSSDIGKILRINRDGSIPKDNPFRAKAGALPQIWSYGHRNPYGFYEDTDSGFVWEVEPAAMGGDELNRIQPGRDYGWATVSWSFDYNHGLIGPKRTAPHSETPILVWTPSVTPSGIARYQGKDLPFWKGDYFVGTLNGRVLERLRIKQGEVVLRERLLGDLGERYRDVKIGPDEQIYLLTDHDNGRLLRLTSGIPTGEQRSKVAHRLPPPPPSELSSMLGNPTKGKEAFIERCSMCHSIEKQIAGGAIGPDLTKVYGRRAGSLVGYSYSSQMANLPQSWDLISLDRLMADPQGYVPGTNMAAPPVTEMEIRSNILAFLKNISEHADAQ